VLPWLGPDQALCEMLYFLHQLCWVTAQCSFFIGLLHCSKYFLAVNFSSVFGKLYLCPLLLDVNPQEK
jgi:hypothetical protein